MDALVERLQEDVRPYIPADKLHDAYVAIAVAIGEEVGFVSWAGGYRAAREEIRKLLAQLDMSGISRLIDAELPFEEEVEIHG